MVPREYACRVHDLKMAGLGNDSRSIIGKCVLLMFLIAVQVTGEEDCNEVNCPGELIVRYYKGIGCTPVYANPNDCCAEAYNCSHLNNLSRDKCYVNGNEYSIGEMLKPEDSNPCDWNCTCTNFEDTAFFQCERLTDCNDTEERSCLYRRTHGLCCANPFCDKEEADNTTCNVDGKVYKAGEYFYPKANTKLLCLCMEGYTGENIEPFCQQLNRDPCSVLFGVGAPQVHDKWLPVFLTLPNYYCYQPLYRGPDIKNVDSEEFNNVMSVSEGDTKTCRFYNDTKLIGEEFELGPPVSWWTIDMKCKCEVPPFVTCHRSMAIPEEEDQSRDNF